MEADKGIIDRCEAYRIMLTWLLHNKKNFKKKKKKKKHIALIVNQL
jgi:hypothetical protein